MKKPLKKVVAENIRALLGIQEGARGATSALLALGIANGDATRALKGETSIGLDKLAELAEKLKVQPWQLCVPDLDPNRLPSVEPMTFRWPFRQVDPEVVTGLVGTVARNVETGLLVALATAGVSPRKEQRTGTK